MDENSVLFIFNRENRLLLLVFFSENLKLLFLQLGGREEMEGIFHLALFCLFCQCLCYLENIFVFLEGKVIKFIVQKGVYLGSKMKLLCLGACLVCLM